MDQKSRSRRSWAYGSSSAIATVFFVGILVFVALISERHSWRVDLSESGSYTLSEQTRNILKSLTQPVTVKAFFQTAAPDRTRANDLLETYHYYHKDFTFEFVDPVLHPEEVRKYDVRTHGTLVLEGFDRKQMVQTVDEESLTNGLLKLTRPDQKKVYFLVGHGEHSFKNAEQSGYSNTSASLQKENYQIAELNLLQQSQVPTDAAVVIVAGPKKSLFPEEIATLEAYLKAGGKLMPLLDPYVDAGLGELARRYGIQVDNDVVVDKLSRLFGASYLTPVVLEYAPHKITRDFQESSVATFFPEARSISPAKEPPQGVQVEAIASTSPNAWGETNLTVLKQGEAAFDDKQDIAGPVPIATLAEIDVPSSKPQDAPKAEDELSTGKKESPPESSAKKAHLLVVGDSDFANNTNFGLSGNGDLFLNMVNFLAEEENLITISRKEKEGRPMMMTQSQGMVLFWTVMVLVPLLVVGCGLGVYRVRRRQR
ncbi:MAG: GldG family protein [Syntrophobacteraceae bacterium]